MVNLALTKRSNKVMIITNIYVFYQRQSIQSLFYFDFLLKSTKLSLYVTIHPKHQDLFFESFMFKKKNYFFIVSNIYYKKAMSENPNRQSQNRIHPVQLNIIPNPAPQSNVANRPAPSNSFTLNFLGMVVTQNNLNFIEQNKILFISGKTQLIDPQRQTYFQMIKVNFFPHLVWYSLPFLLIYTCTIVFIVQVSLGFYNNTFLEVNQDTYTKMGVNLSQQVYRGQIYRLIVSIFLHVNMIHLVSNMLSLLIIMAVIQYSFGGKRTLAVFLISGIIGNIFSNLISSDVQTTMIKLGASNSLYGMIGLSIGYMIINWQALEIIGPIFKLKITLTIIFGGIFLIMFTDQASKVDYVGHLGGLLSGLFISGLMPSLKLQTRQKVLRIILSLLFLAMFLACFLVFYLAPPSSYSS